jgi:hypothetical protein
MEARAATPLVRALKTERPGILANMGATGPVDNPFKLPKVPLYSCVLFQDLLRSQVPCDTWPRKAQG